MNLFRPLNLEIPNSIRSVLNLQKMNKSQTKKRKESCYQHTLRTEMSFQKIVIPSAFSLFLIQINKISNAKINKYADITSRITLMSISFKFEILSCYTYFNHT